MSPVGYGDQMIGLKGTGVSIPKAKAGNTAILAQRPQVLCLFTHGTETAGQTFDKDPVTLSLQVTLSKALTKRRKTVR